MSWSQQDLSFKTLLNKRVTSSSKNFYEEIGDDSINAHLDQLWTGSISSTPSVAVTAGVAELRTLFTLTEETSVANQQCYYAYETGSRLHDWISDKYGTAYAVRLFQNNGTEIYPTDSCQWLFNYQTGILIFSGSTAAFSKPFKITGYRYIGGKGITGIETGLSGYGGSTAYGEMYIAAGNTEATLLSTQGTYYKVNDTGLWSAGEASGFTINSTNGVMTCNTAGTYRFNATILYSCDSSTDSYAFALYKNGVIVSKLSVRTNSNTSSSIGNPNPYENELYVVSAHPSIKNISIVGLSSLQTNDTIELYVACTTSANNALVISQANLYLSRV